jgi:cell wall assembly regulator SMI1
VQEFTRPITREVEVGGERVAVTFSADGVSLRTVGSRKPPRELGWSAVLCRLMPSGAEPKPEEVAAALKALKAGAPTPAKETPMPSADVPALLARLETWLKAHRPRYAKGLRPGADAAKFEMLRSRLGVAVPPELQAVLAWHDGQSLEFVGAFEQSYFLMDADRVAAARQEMMADEDSGWESGWLPFLDDGRDNFLFLDTSRPGNPVRAYWQGNLEQPVVAPSLAAWLHDFVTTVERGQYVEDPERGDFLRTS